MPRAKRDEILRHETKTDEDEELFANRDSGIVINPGHATETILRKGKGSSRGKGKRSLEDMMASMPNDVTQCAYALERIAATEDKIAEILKLCSQEAREMVLKQRPSLKRYAPED